MKEGQTQEPVGGMNCANHKKDLYGETNMKVAAEAIGDLHYETLADLLGSLTEKLYNDSKRDKLAGREILSEELLFASQKLDSAACRIQKAWKISKPFMLMNEPTPPPAPIKTERFIPSSKENQE